MAIQDTNICNTDLLQSSKFIFSIPSLVATQFFVQAANIPGVNSTNTFQTTPFRDVAVPGDKMEYEDLNIEFLVDEELRSWLAIYHWIEGYTFAEKFEDYKNLGNISKYQKYEFMQYPQYGDAFLITLSASGKQLVKFQFVDIFPTYLSQIPLDVRISSEKTITATASFRFKRYTIERV